MHFFKIFHSSIIRDKRLELPKEFARKFGKELSESDYAIIEVPNGIWHIGMRKAEGLVFFDNGWPEFMEFYSICVGHLMVFKYDGNSKFQVLIFGMKATEIKYPSHFESTNHEGEVISTHSDDVEVISAHPAEVEIISVHSDSSTQSNGEPSLSTLGVFAWNEDNHNQMVESARCELPQPCQLQRDFSSKSRPKRSCTAAFQASQLQESALKAAAKFTSDNPFFKATMRSSYLKRGTVGIPNTIGSSYLKNRTRLAVTLMVSDGRTWEARYLCRVKGRRSLSGLGTFVSDNHLKEGDVCVFELVNRINVHHIFRVSQEIISIHPGSRTKREPSMSTLVEFASSEGRLSQEAEPAAHEFPQASWKRKAFSSKFSHKRSYITAFQASRLQERAAEKFTSDNPFYKVLMRPSYVRGGYVRVPMVFAKRYLKITTQMAVTLGVSDGRTWEVLYLARAQHDRRLSRGWRKFVSDNHLKEGDLCVFELVDRINVEMNVNIFRASQEIVSIHSGSGTQTKDEPPMSTLVEFASSSEGRVNQKAEPATHEFPQASRKRKAFSSKFAHKRSYTTAFQASQLLESALEAAEDFTSDDPFYKVLMRPSYVKGGYVVIPKAFGTSYLKKRVRMVVTLRVSDGRTWKVWRVSRSRNTMKLSLGWNEFVTDNHVKEGDVCVFELVDKINFEMHVHIFRV
ncbi:hypothetical protein MKW98_032267 [Papaver atlanticum]|uniref:TF-B3 domain-containing protein n=1 Tax=Papaver atlanticum TaxID=357466 RepID=A0AAD4SEK5_9MAGN|nr:hypothetical protein MKW98_032267 [Papaver atlanticum]